MIDLSAINYYTKKIVVENLTNTAISIGDLRIVLQRNGALNLLYINPVTKKQLRTYNDIINSNDLKSLISTSKVRLYIDDVVVNDTEASIKSLELSSNYDSNINKKRVDNLSSTTTNLSLDLSSFSAHKLTLTTDTTISFINIPQNSSYIFYLTVYQDADVQYEINFPNTVKWDSGLSPAYPGVGEIDIYSFMTVDGGSTWFGFQTGDAMS